MIDFAIAVWTAAAAVSFAVLPLIGLGVGHDSWVAAVWDGWRLSYAAALLACAGGAALKIYRHFAGRSGA